VQAPYAVIDVETTGLPQHHFAHPIQVGVVFVDANGDEVEAHEWLVVPPETDAQEAAEAEKTHGIPLSRVWAEGISARESTERLKALVRSHDTPWLFAYNLSFERIMLERMGFTYTKWGDCVMEYASHDLKRNKRTISLNHALSEYRLPGREPGAPHSALSDARLALLLSRASGLLPGGSQ